MPLNQGHTSYKFDYVEGNHRPMSMAWIYRWANLHDMVLAEEEARELIDKATKRSRAISDLTFDDDIRDIILHEIMEEEVLGRVMECDEAEQLALNKNLIFVDYDD